jgi:hypothetical protein
VQQFPTFTRRSFNPLALDSPQIRSAGRLGQLSRYLRGAESQVHELAGPRGGVSAGTGSRGGLSQDVDPSRKRSCNVAFTP